MLIILLGEGCQVSWDIDKLYTDKDKPRSIFEWFLSIKFTDILTIINKLHIGEELEVTRRENDSDNLFMDHTDIRTTHFSKSELYEILKRRGKRFIDQVKSDEDILFIRYEHPEYITTQDDLQQFETLIKQINPECMYNLLLFTAYDNLNLLPRCHNTISVLHDKRKDLQEYIRNFERILDIW